MKKIGNYIGERLYELFPAGTVVSGSPEGQYEGGIPRGASEAELLESAAMLLGKEKGTRFLGQMAAEGFDVDVQALDS